MSNQDSGVTEGSATEKGLRDVSPQIGDQGVANYLRSHPNFFEDKPSLLSDLRVPHQTGSAVSLVERQVATLRESNENRQAQLDGLIQIARDNDRLNSHLHQLTLQLMEAGELETLLSIISDRLKDDFDADLVSVHLLCSPVSEANSSLPEIVADIDDYKGLFKNVIKGTRGGAKPYCGRLKDEQLQILFTDRAGDIGSSALLPLGNEGALGLLAIGSLDRNRFTIGTDTHFLARMAEIITAALGKHLKP
ncbi:MAG: DUF484 family protein [Gammaproteobacteria bacterium]|nr:DUF484 family protein [Gammaproteobacteria bacterium]